MEPIRIEPNAPPRRAARARLAPLGLLALLGTGCHGSVFVGGVPSVILEQEPNDNLFQANHLGLIGFGETIRIQGTITDAGFDPFDGFAVYVDAPCEIDFTLVASNPAADLDLCVFDGAGFQVGCFQSPGNAELGEVEVYGPLAGLFELHFVVESFVGTTSYTLELHAHSIFSAASAGEEGAGARIEPDAPAPAERAGRFDAYVPGPLAGAPAEDDEEQAVAAALLIRQDGAGRILGVEPIGLRADGVVLRE